MNLDERIQRYLAAIPPAIAGQRGHDQTFKVACALVNGFDLVEEQALYWLQLFNEKCQPPWSERELAHKVASAFAANHQRRRGHLLGNGNGATNTPQGWIDNTANLPSATPGWPQPDTAMIEEICREGIALNPLHDASPVKIDSRALHAEEITDTLFPGDQWLCCGVTPYQFSTKRRADWRGSLADQSFIVPSAMRGRFGFTQDGQISEHTLCAVGPRQYLVVEFDFALKSRDGKHDTALAPLIRSLDACNITVADMCAALLAHLARFAPLTLVVHSGGKSLHGWFPCAGVPEDELRGFMCYACQLGADPKTWPPSQFVRMPDGTRYGDDRKPRRQRVCFWNPEALSHV
jgi:hypothetical protein